MPAFDELRNELDILCDEGLTVDKSFHKLVKHYSRNAEKREQLVHFQEQLEREGHSITWPDL